MPAATGSPAMSFLTRYIGRNKKAPYGDVAAAAKRYGHDIYPVMYGRAKALLGLVPVKRRSTQGATKGANRGAVLSPARRRRPTLRLDSLDQLRKFLDGYRALQTERDRLRTAIEEISRAAERATR